MEPSVDSSVTGLHCTTPLQKLWKFRKYIYLLGISLSLFVVTGINITNVAHLSEMNCIYFFGIVFSFMLHAGIVLWPKHPSTRSRTLLGVTLAVNTMILLCALLANKSPLACHLVIYALGLKFKLAPSMYVHTGLEVLLFYLGLTEFPNLILALYFILTLEAANSYQSKKKVIRKRRSSDHIKALKEKTDNLSVKNKFIAIITHEIRNFVTNIVTNASLLKESRMYDEEIVDEIVQASSFLSEILNNTLDISKLDEGKIEFNNSYESIKSVIDIVLSICKANADKRKVKLDAVYPETLPELLEFDKARLTQVVMNLVGNAIKFTPEKGKVTVKVNWKSTQDSEKMLPTIASPTKSGSFIDNENEGSLSPHEKVPDENSPINCPGGKSLFDSFSAYKIPGKIKAHSFIVKSHAFLSRSQGPSVREGVRGDNFSSGRIHKVQTITPLTETSPFIVDSTRALEDANDTNRKCSKKLSTFCILPTPLEAEQKVTPPASIRRKTLKNVGKDFRMTQKNFPRISASKNFTPQKRREPAKSTCSFESPARIPRSQKITAGTLSVEVIDTGCGMSEAEKEKLFQPFSQTSKQVYGKFGGTGLGLWLSSKLIHAMNGNILCKSAPDQGTIFRIDIPTKSKPGEVSSPTGTKGKNGFKGFTVLCYLKDAEEVEGILRKPGCNTIILKSFEDLLDTLRVPSITLYDPISKTSK